MASSSTTTTATNNQSNPSNTESTIYEYMRQFVDYQENGINLNELSQIRQLDIYLQSKFLFDSYFPSTMVLLQVVMIVFKNLLPNSKRNKNNR